ncbi:hypothetical protein ACFVFF_23140 [Streptomyces sp. NPDC057680]|uniref:hypothetical protein n=1 Tax=Streptomyces sp. NPDC057680 TaxID=3346208 RepID=UPI00367824E9
MSRYLDTLLALADTAEKRPLTRREADVLRNQLHALDANRRQVSGLQAAVHSARQEIELIAGVIGPLVGRTGRDVVASVKARKLPRS